MSVDHEQFMRLAIEEGIKGRAEGNSGVGTVIVRGDTVVAVGRNLVTSTNDPTAHAETVALREAGAALQSPDLSGCSLYTSFQPCPMCCGAIMVAGIERVVMGGRPTPETNQYGPYTPEQLLEQTGWGDRVEVINGILVEECQSIR